MSDTPLWTSELDGQSMGIILHTGTEFLMDLQGIIPINTKSLVMFFYLCIYIFSFFYNNQARILTIFNFITIFIAQAKQHFTQEWNSNNTINQSRAVTLEALLMKLSFYEAVDWWVINEMTWNFTDRLS